MTKINVSDEALAYSAMRFSRPNGLAGTINKADAAFLFDMLMRARPRTMAEIGVASGVSTAFLATLFADRLRDSRLYSFERLEILPGDPPRPVGHYLRKLFGELPKNLTLAPGIGSTDIAAWPLCPDGFDFVFLDARHSHPWPCNDLLAIIGIIAPGAWVVLHDVWLPIINREFQTFGPLYLYQMWPGEKCTPAGNDTNIGAIRLFDDPAESAAALIECCTVPWQDRMSHTDWAAALNALSRIDDQSYGRLRTTIARPPMAKRPLLRDCEIVVRGANSWSRFAADLTSESMLLHANRRGEPAMSILVRGLKRRHCTGVVFPSIVRSDDALEPLCVTLALRSPDRMHEVAANLVLGDSSPYFAFLRADESLGETFDAEIGVSVSGASEATRGAWAKFEAVHFV